MEQVAAWRQQRQQQQVQDRLNQMREEYRETVRERDQAIAENDMETAGFRDDDAMRLEQEWLSYVGPQQPQMDPRAQEWIRRNSQFFEKYGEKASQAVREAHAYVCRPRNPATNNPAHTGCGMGNQVYSPAYWDKLESVLEMHGPMYFGINYDPSAKSLDANEAARISGLDPKSYNAAARTVHAQDRLGTDRK
jgi:hypothetical protein